MAGRNIVNHLPDTGGNPNSTVNRDSLDLPCVTPVKPLDLRLVTAEAAYMFLLNELLVKIVSFHDFIPIPYALESCGVWARDGGGYSP